MTDAADITDEHLTAYLDGEADADLRTRIELALDRDEALKARLGALTLDIAALQTQMRASYPPPPPMPALPKQTAPRRSAVTFATGLAAGLAVSALLFAGYATRPQPPEGWASFVASYQMLYTAETLSITNPSDAEAAAQLRHASELVGLDLDALPQVAGLTFKKAQVLGFRGKPLVQIAYQRADGTPVALCIILSEPQSPLALTGGEARGLQTVRWNSARHGFLLIGDVEADPLRQAAEAFATSL